MKKFRFPLQTVRELRESQEQTAQRAYHEAVRECEQASLRLATIEGDLRAAWDLLRNDETMCIDETRRRYGWCVVLLESQKLRAAELDAAQRKVEAKHALLVAATRQREVMDRLWEKQRRAFDRDVIIEEQKFLDEIATRRAWQPELEAA